MKRFEVAMLLLALVSLGIGACSEDQTPPDSGYPDGDDGDGGCAVTCQRTEDCCAGQECIAGVCSAGDACPSGCNYECDKTKNQVCNKATKKCETGAPPVNCVDDCDCYSAETCVAGACRPSGGDEISCTIDDECPSGQKCINNKCRPSSCTTREDCAGATCLVCQNNECVIPPTICQSLEDCCVGYKCNFGQCTPEATGCTSDSYCEALNPEFPRCNLTTGECLPECLNDIDCPLPGQVCLNQECITPGCTPESCQQGQWCNTGSGQCEAGCDSNDDCVPPDTCNYGTHVCGQTDCCGGACDPASTYCDTLTCQCADKCSFIRPCPEGFDCDTATGICKCVTNPDPCPTGAHCDAATGQCVSDTPTCQTDTDCGAGYYCDPYTSTCIPTGGGQLGDACFQDSECNAAAGLLCDGSIFCLLCAMLDATFNPSFTCRYECSLLDGQCPVADHTCKYWHTGVKGICVPNSP